MSGRDRVCLRIFGSVPEQQEAVQGHFPFCSTRRDVFHALSLSPQLLEKAVAIVRASFSGTAASAFIDKYKPVCRTVAEYVLICERNGLEMSDDCLELAQALRDRADFPSQCFFRRSDHLTNSKCDYCGALQMVEDWDGNVPEASQEELDEREEEELDAVEEAEEAFDAVAFEALRELEAEEASEGSVAGSSDSSPMALVTDETPSPSSASE